MGGYDGARCDECGVWFDAIAHGAQVSSSPVVIDLLLARQGWEVQDGRHICPAHPKTTIDVPSAVIASEQLALWRGMEMREIL